MTTTVSNSSASSNPDYPVKTSLDGTDVVQHVNVDSMPTVTATITGVSTEAKQDVGNTSLSSIDGKITACNTGAVVVSSGTVVVQGFDSINELNKTLQTDTTGTLKITGQVNLTSGSVVSTKTAIAASSPTFATVGTSSATAVSTNVSRRGLVLTNTSANRISLGIGLTAVLDRGITLYPQGVWVMDEYTFTQEAITAIASAAGSNLAIQEFSA